MTGWRVGSSVPSGDCSSPTRCRWLLVVSLDRGRAALDPHSSLDVPGHWGAEDLPSWVLACAGYLRLLLADDTELASSPPRKAYNDGLLQAFPGVRALPSPAWASPFPLRSMGEVAPGWLLWPRWDGRPLPVPHWCSASSFNSSSRGYSGRGQRCFADKMFTCIFSGIGTYFSMFKYWELQHHLCLTNPEG